MNNLFKRVALDKDFLGNYVKLVTDVVIPYQEKVLRDQIDSVEKSHAIENFTLAAQKMTTGKIDGTFYGMVFQDSDVAKWLEAAAYSLSIKPNPDLEKRCDDFIETIGQAQHDDGYLNTYFTVKAPEKRWTNLREAHELYCAGHMIEAAVAYAEATGKTALLEIMCRLADHIYDRFIVQNLPGYGGHPEIELALMRLYYTTANEKYLELAEHFINTRGVDSDFYIKERAQNPWDVWGNDPQEKEYLQNHLPVRQQDTAVGHAVRAVYLYSGMADVAKKTNDTSLTQVCKTLWRNIADRRMYITGAIGSSYEGEAFTEDYHLPNDTAYAETCASIGLIFFARRMLDLEPNSEYADIMERALYNCVLAGMELDGTRFFYVNPLEVLPGISGKAKTHKHSLPQRPKWFSCACCPPNVARLLTSIGSYAWGLDDNIVYSHLFLSSALSLDSGNLSLKTAYPNNSQLVYSFQPKESAMPLTLAVRLPSWSDNAEILLNGKPIEYSEKNGYAFIQYDFTRDDMLTVNFAMSAKRTYSHTQVSSNSGKTAFSFGPLVYCAEGVDNANNVLSLFVKKNGTVKTQQTDILGGVCQLIAEGYTAKTESSLYSNTPPTLAPCEIVLTPYYTWGNRGLTQMRVWIPEAE